MINFNGTSFSAAQASNNLINFNGASMCTVVDASTRGICYDCQCLYLSQQGGWCCVAPSIKSLPVYLWSGADICCLCQVRICPLGNVYVLYSPIANCCSLSYASVCLRHAYPAEVGNSVCAQVTNVGNCVSASAIARICFPLECGVSSVNLVASYDCVRAGCTVTTDAFGAAQVKCKGVPPAGTIPSHRRIAEAMCFKRYELGVPFCQGRWMYVYTTACRWECICAIGRMPWINMINCISCCVPTDLTTCLESPIVVRYSPEISDSTPECIAYAAWYAATYCCRCCVLTCCSDIYTFTCNCSSRTVCFIRPGVSCSYSLSGYPVWRNVSV